MCLFIDTSDRQKVVVSLGTKTRSDKSGVDRGQQVVKALDRLLGTPAEWQNSVSGVEVVSEGESFTGLRVGASVANTIGFVLGVKVNKKDVLKDGPVEPTYL